MNNECLLCLLKRHLQAADKLGDAKTGEQFAKALLRLYADAPDGISTPWLSDKINDLFVQFYHIDPDRYKDEKERSNRFVLARLEQIQQKAAGAEDPVYAGLQLAILGNYIDFGALQGEVSFEELDAMLQKADEMELDKECYQQLLCDLQNAKTLLYLTDNAGEIVFDRVFAEQLQKKFPQLQITFCVRGGPAANDATREDALEVGIPFPVIDNGNLIPGTFLEQLSGEAKQAMDRADVILSKGQGNAETLLGCGYPIFYAFLIKCQLFIDRFGKPKLTPMLVKERN